MSLSENDIIAIARQHVAADRRANCVIHWATTPKRTGDPVLVGRNEQPMPFDGYFVFIDLMPQANWGHPARCLLIRSDGAQVQATDVQFPPHLGSYPDCYRTLVI